LKRQFKKQSILQKTNLYFDFDGTLFDSKQGIFLALKKTAEEVYNIDCELTEENIGPPISIIHDLIFPEYKKKDAFVKAFRKFYDNTYYIYSKPYYKSIQLFSDLISFNCSLNIVSNKPTTIINKLLDLNNIEKYFNQVSGNSEINLSKKERLKSLVEIENKICENIVIGDTIEDYEMAKYTNCKFIFAKYGYGTINTEVVCLDKLDSLIKLIQNS
jgi:phosphoglycolate phosphatase